jgi:Tfp pilus assembly protein PilF
LATLHGRERAARAAAPKGDATGGLASQGTGAQLALALLLLLTSCSTAGLTAERDERTAEERGAQSGTWREARSAEERFRAGGDGASEACCAAARAYLEVDASEHALALIDEGLKLDPTHPELLEVRGNALERQGFRRAAEASYSAALTLDPSRSSARVARAHLRLALGLAQGARSDYELALSAGADAPETWLGYAQALAGAGEPRRAFDAFAQAFARGSADAPHRIAAARLLVDGHVRPRRPSDDDQAIAWLIDAQMLAPKDVQAPILLAALHEQRGDLESARAALEGALAIEPDAQDALVALARVCESRGDAGCAAEAARRALDHERDPARRAWLAELAGAAQSVADRSRQ